MLDTGNTLVVPVPLNAGNMHITVPLFGVGKIETAKPKADVTNGDNPGQRSYPRSHAAVLVAGPHDPLAVFLPDDPSDMMSPNHHSAHMRRCRSADVRPIARQPQLAALLTMDAELVGHFSTTPRQAAGPRRRNIAAIKISSVVLFWAVSVSGVMPAMVMISVVEAVCRRFARRQRQRYRGGYQ